MKHRLSSSSVALCVLLLLLPAASGGSNKTPSSSSTSSLVSDESPKPPVFPFDLLTCTNHPCTHTSLLQRGNQGRLFSSSFSSRALAPPPSLSRLLSWTWGHTDRETLEGTTRTIPSMFPHPAPVPHPGIVPFLPPIFQPASAPAPAPDATCRDGPHDTTCASQARCDGQSSCCFNSGKCKTSSANNCLLADDNDPRFPPASGPDVINQVSSRRRKGGGRLGVLRCS